MTTSQYILIGQTPVPETDLEAWAIWFSTADRRVARTELPDGSVVSTVFLGLDHQWGTGPPMLFETMVFNGKEDIQYRYSTWAEAAAGHAAVVARFLDGDPLRRSGRANLDD